MTQENTSLLEKRLEQLIDVLKRPAIPLDIALWDASEGAAYLRVSESQYKERYACRPDFPRAIRLPVEGSTGRGHPKWKALEVIEWAQRWQERKRAA